MSASITSCGHCGHLYTLKMLPEPSLGYSIDTFRNASPAAGKPDTNQRAQTTQPCDPRIVQAYVSATLFGLF